MNGETAQLYTYFVIGVALTLIVGLYSLVTTRNLIRVLIALEVLIKAVTLLIIASGYAAGQIALAQALAITLIIIEVAVIVVAVGVVLCLFRHHKSVDATLIRNIKG